MRIPLGCTKVGTSNQNYPLYQEGELNLPFRDGVHSLLDQEKLGVECYAVTPSGIFHVMRETVKA